MGDGEKAGTPHSVGRTGCEGNLRNGEIGDFRNRHATGVSQSGASRGSANMPRVPQPRRGLAGRNAQAGGGIKGVDGSHAPCVKPGRPHVITPSNSTNLMTPAAVRARCGQRMVASGRKICRGCGGDPGAHACAGVDPRRAVLAVKLWPPISSRGAPSPRERGTPTCSAC